jgi:MFS transporter, MCT family, solute carrier family 16 (monocarboxylic acid transporters), member 10
VCMTLIPEWFVARRGVVVGILFAGKRACINFKHGMINSSPLTLGTAAGGLILPLALAPLLSHLGPNKTLRILAVVVGVTLLPSLTLIRGRLPINRIHGPTSRASNGFFYLKDIRLWILLITNLLQSMAYVFSLVSKQEHILRSL